MKNNRYKYILSNYVKPEFIYTNESSCNCSLINDNVLLSGWRNFTFIEFKSRKKFEKIIGRHIWFNDTLWSDEKLYKIENNKTKFLKFLTKTTNHNLKSCGCEDFRIMNWNNKNYVLYSKIVSPFTKYEEHFSELDSNLNLINDKVIHTNNKIEKNWQPIETKPFECIYSYKPFKTINLKTQKFKEYNNFCNLNFRGSTQVVKYKNYLICIVHLRNENESHHYYTHYFAIFDENLKLLKITSPFSFMGAEIEFCTYLKNNKNTLEILYSVNDQLSFKYKIPEQIVDKIIADNLDNNTQEDNLYEKLYNFSKQNNNVFTSICLATYVKDKNILAEAIKLNYSSKLSKDKKIVLQKILLEKFYDTK